MEVDWNPEDPSKTEGFVALCGDFDFLLGSLHYYQMGSIAARDPTRFVMNYYDQWELAFSSGYFQIMSHMDFYKVILGGDWFQKNKNNSVIFERARCALAKLGEHNRDLENRGLSPVAIEVNTGCSQYDGLDMTLPSENIARIAIEFGIPISLGSDAHFSEEVGRNIKEVLEMFQRNGLERLCYFVKKQIMYYLVNDAIRSLPTINNRRIKQTLSRKRAEWSLE